MELAADVASWILLGAGSLFAMIGGLGVLRLPDFYTRLHGASVTDTAGAGFILLGLMVQAGLTLVTVKLLVVLAFFLFTSPIATHALAKAALGEGLQPLTKRDTEEQNRSNS